MHIGVETIPPHAASGLPLCSSTKRIGPPPKSLTEAASVHLLYILNNPLAGTDPTGYAVEATKTGCQAMTGSRICGVDTGARGGVTSQTFTLRDGQGGVARITESVGANGERSFTGTWSPGNGARSQHGVTSNSRDGSSKGAQAIEGVEARDRMQFGLGVVKDGLNTAGELLSPCSGASTAGDCAKTVAISGAVGIGVGYVAGRLYRGAKDSIELGLDVLSQRLLGEQAAREGVETVVQRYWSRTEVNGVRVYQRTDLIDPTIVDARNRTNLQRMRMGLAPVGPDGESMQLHHMLQTRDSPLAEVTRSFHEQYNRVLHINPSSMRAGIHSNDGGAWDRQREAYWKERARDFEP